MIYRSDDFSDLVLAADSAYMLSLGDTVDESLLKHEICCILSAADTLIEKEHLTFGNII